MTISSIKPASFRVDTDHVGRQIARTTSILGVAGVVVLAALAVGVIAIFAPFAGPLTPCLAGAVALAGAGVAWRQIMRRRWLAGLLERGELVGIDADGIRLVRDIVIPWSNVSRLVGAQAEESGRGREAFVGVTVRDVVTATAGASGPFRSVVVGTATGGGAAILFLDGIAPTAVPELLAVLARAAAAAGIPYVDESGSTDFGRIGREAAG